MEIFDDQQEPLDSLHDNIRQLRDILNKNQAKNRKALSWVREMEMNVDDFLRSLRVMKNRVLRLQSELDELPVISESENSEEED